MSASDIRRVLDVVGGAQRGARAPVAESTSTTLGSALECDIVLSDPRVPELAMTFVSGADGLSVEVHAEGVSRDGETLAPGTHALAGEENFALGDTRLVLSTSEETGAVTDALGDVADAAPVPAWFADRSTPCGGDGELAGTAARDGASFKPLMVALSAVTLFGTLAIGVSYWSHRSPPVSEAVPSAVAMVEPPSRKVPRLLADNGFDDVAYVSGSNVEARLTGHVASRARLLELQRLVRGLTPKPRIAVHVQDEVVQGVEDFYRTQGLEATVESVEAGVVAVVTRVAEAERLAGIEARAMGDVPGLVLLQSRNETPEKAPEKAPERVRRPPVEDADKRVVAVVTGNPSYVVTADDSRYFVGSSLPTGHTIAEIDADSVVLDREGERTRLEF